MTRSTTAMSPAQDANPDRPRSARKGEPTWEVAQFFPDQGYWSEEAYLALNPENKRVEYVNGFLEVLPMPTMMHERILRFLFLNLHEFVTQRNLGEVFFAGIRMKLEPGGEKQYRVPDLVFMRHDHAQRMDDDFWQGADLAIEIVSPDDPKRDLEEKRIDYARGGVPEYWIIKPQSREIIILTLHGDRYEIHGTFRPGDQVTSMLLEGFKIDAAAVFDAGKAG